MTPCAKIFTARQCALLAKIGIFSVEQLLLYVPIRHEDRRTLSTISEGILQQRAVLVKASVLRHENFLVRLRGKMTRVPKVVITDGSAVASLVCWGQAGVAKSLPLGQHFYFFAKFNFQHNTIQSSSFEYVPLDQAGKNPLMNRIVPIYKLTEGLYQKELHRMIYKAFSSVELPDILPKAFILGRRLMGRKESLKSLHYPQDFEILEKARQYAAYEELLSLRLSLESKRREEEKILKPHSYPQNGIIQKFESILPFTLTKAQKRVLSEIQKDLQRPHPMHRLIQGDVGSGKTMAALGAMLIAAASGNQAAFLAPTEVLAFQHYKKIRPLAEELGFSCALLTGSIRQRTEILSGLGDGSLPLIIGTHALFQKEVEYKNLTLVVVDEQHKFGVGQRSAMMDKGKHPDLLLMTATPIPRTMTLALYGDLGVSLIDELPPGRSPIRTQIYTEADIPALLELLDREISKGRQAFVVCPLIDENEGLNALSVEEVLEFYRTHTSHKCAVIHGRMGQEEKDKLMGRFSEGKFDILIATTVIEVGIDIPNAAVMVIENAERFGLSQLHQLRGRVGRGGYQSYCLAVNRGLQGEGESPIAGERLKIFSETQDGFILAEADLKLRGGGEMLGTRQTGDGFFTFANLITDSKILEAAISDANKILDADADLSLPVHRGLKSLITQSDTRYLS